MRRGNFRSDTRVFTSNCGDMRLRGTPAQLVEKHEQLAREA
ncbi:MAG: DUF4167 domain-containing protein, partial [Alphaproteobacteria bacterium]|nr:DUF4167 domain-containing protein [Alphaproteobacteria bacterium]